VPSSARHPAWNLYDSPSSINYFLGGLGALLGPLFGILIADYCWSGAAKSTFPRSTPRIPTALTTTGPCQPARGRGIHTAAALSLIVAFTPALHAVSPFAWFIAWASEGQSNINRRPHCQLRRRVRRSRSPSSQRTDRNKSKSQMRILVVNVNTTESIQRPSANRPRPRHRPAPRSSLSHRGSAQNPWRATSKVTSPRSR